MVVFGGLVIVDLLLSLSPPRWVSFGNADKVAHGLGYGALAVLILVLAQSRIGRILGVVSLIGLGVFLEYLQVFIPEGDASLADGVASVLGVLGGVMVFAVWRYFSLGGQGRASVKDVLDVWAVPLGWMLRVVGVSGGIGLNQLLHTLAYAHTGTRYIDGFPNVSIPVVVSYGLSAVLVVVSFVLFVWMFPVVIKRPQWVLLLAVPLVAISQVCGRGLIKGVFDGMAIGILYVYLVITKAYPPDGWSREAKEVLSLVHDELLTLLDISVSMFTFIWGAMGVAFALEFLRSYYTHQVLRYYGMLWYGAMVVYLGIQFLLFVTYTIYRRMIWVRRELRQKTQMDSLASQ